MREDGTMIQQMIQVPLVGWSSRNVALVAVADGNVYAGTIDTTALATNGDASSSSLATDIKISMAEVDGVVWIVDGSRNKPLGLTLSTSTCAEMIEAAGTVEADIEIVCNWYGRLVCAKGKQVYASRSGDATDYDYAAGAAGDVSAAWAETDLIRDQITALAAFRKDYLVIGCDNSIKMYAGDPGDGGTLEIVSDRTGILGPDAWTIDDGGNMWFVSSGGLFMMSQPGTVTQVSAGVRDNFFSEIDRIASWVTCRYDAELRAIWVFVTPKTASETPGTHTFYALPRGMQPGFWGDVRFGSDSYGPVSAVWYDGNTAGDRKLVLGGRSGVMRVFDPLATSDDGVAITSEIVAGPVRYSDQATETKLLRADFVLGKTPEVFAAETASRWCFDYAIQGGDDAYEAVTAPEQIVTGRFTTAGRQEPFGLRMANGAFAVKISNSQINRIWSVESVNVNLGPGGRER